MVFRPIPNLPPRTHPTLARQHLPETNPLPTMYYTQHAQGVQHYLPQTPIPISAPVLMSQYPPAHNAMPTMWTQDTQRLPQMLPQMTTPTHESYPSPYEPATSTYDVICQESKFDITRGDLRKTSYRYVMDQNGKVVAINEIPDEIANRSIPTDATMIQMTLFIPQASKTNITAELLRAKLEEDDAENLSGWGADGQSSESGENSSCDEVDTTNTNEQLVSDFEQEMSSYDSDTHPSDEGLDAGAIDNCDNWGENERNAEPQTTKPQLSGWEAMPSYEMSADIRSESESREDLESVEIFRSGSSQWETAENPEQWDDGDTQYDSDHATTWEEEEHAGDSTAIDNAAGSDDWNNIENTAPWAADTTTSEANDWNVSATDWEDESGAIDDTTDWEHWNSAGNTALWAADTAMNDANDWNVNATSLEDESASDYAEQEPCEEWTDDIVDADEESRSSYQW